MNHDCNILISQIQYIQKKLPVSASRSTSLLANHLLLLPWCMTIAGYGINSDDSSSQQQPSVGYKQTSKLLPGASLATRVKTTMNIIYLTLTLCPPFHAPVIILSVAIILLVFTSAC